MATTISRSLGRLSASATPMVARVSSASTSTSFPSSSRLLCPICSPHLSPSLSSLTSRSFALSSPHFLSPVPIPEQRTTVESTSPSTTKPLPESSPVGAGKTSGSSASMTAEEKKRRAREAIQRISDEEQPKMGEGKGKKEFGFGGIGEIEQVEPDAKTSTTSGPPPPARRQRKAVLTMTPTAISHLRALSTSPTSQGRSLRISVANKGCAGMSYHLEYITQPNKFDEIVIQDGIKVFVDSKALFSVIGSEMDWKEDRLRGGFIFKNPNVKEQCGCGESFLV